MCQKNGNSKKEIEYPKRNKEDIFDPECDSSRTRNRLLDDLQSRPGQADEQTEDRNNGNSECRGKYLIKCRRRAACWFPNAWLA